MTSYRLLGNVRKTPALEVTKIRIWVQHQENEIVTEKEADTRVEQNSMLLEGIRSILMSKMYAESNICQVSTLAGAVSGKMSY
jgi:hypothetical protein